MSDETGRLLNNAIRIINDNPVRVFLAAEDDDTPCKCCASECSGEVSIEVTFCGMTVSLSLPIPGASGFVEEADSVPQSYLIVEASISCTGCEWLLVISVCAYCDETNQFASDGFYACIPFAEEPESGCCFCPQSGPVTLECFGEQFGIPCVTTATASIA
jgi:hypothetical protein